MQRLPSWLVVAALALLVAIAAADAIRSGGERRAETGAVATSLEGIRGLLVVADERCGTKGFRFPRLASERPSRPPDCGGRLWSQDTTLAARCTENNATEILTEPLEFTARAPGCASAWREDGALALIRQGDIVLWRRRGPERTFFRRAELAAELRTLVERPETYRFAELRWLGRSSFVAIVRGERAWETAVAVFTGTDLETFVPEFGGHIEDLHASPLGNIAFARTNPGREYRMVSRGGAEMRLPRIANAHALAWSPDETWVAIATRNATFIARTGTSRVIARIPVGGESLDWLP